MDITCEKFMEFNFAVFNSGILKTQHQKVYIVNDATERTNMALETGLLQIAQDLRNT